MCCHREVLDPRAKESDEVLVIVLLKVRSEYQFWTSSVHVFSWEALPWK